MHNSCNSLEDNPLNEAITLRWARRRRQVKQLPIWSDKSVGIRECNVTVLVRMNCKDCSASVRTAKRWFFFLVNLGGELLAMIKIFIGWLWSSGRRCFAIYNSARRRARSDPRSVAFRFSPMGSRRIVMLTILWLMYRAEGKVTCREVQLHRDCEALCSTNRNNDVSCELRVAVLLPADPRYDISLPKVLPVLGKSPTLWQAGTSERAELKMKLSFARAPSRV